jgi:hypothetical protein
MTGDEPGVLGSQPRTLARTDSTRTVADIDAAFDQKVFNLTERQGIADVHHHRETDDLGRTVEISEGI